jgi:hypothetical protein
MKIQVNQNMKCVLSATNEDQSRLSKRGEQGDIMTTDQFINLIDYAWRIIGLICAVLGGLLAAACLVEEIFSRIVSKKKHIDTFYDFLFNQAEFRYWRENVNRKKENNEKS